MAGITIPYTIRAVAQEAISKFVDFAKERRVPDDPEKIPIIKKMYDDIWADPRNEALKKRWAEIKKCQVVNGPPSGHDLVILSTAAKYHGKGRIEFLTCDNDFLLFQDTIKQTLDVSIRSAFRLPRVRTNRPVKIGENRSTDGVVGSSRIADASIS